MWGGQLGERGAEPITGVWRQSSQRGPEAEPLVRGKLKGFVIGTPRREAKMATSESIWSPFPTVFFLIGFGQFS